MDVTEIRKPSQIDLDKVDEERKAKEATAAQSSPKPTCPYCGVSPCLPVRWDGAAPGVNGG